MKTNLTKTKPNLTPVTLLFMLAGQRKKEDAMNGVSGDYDVSDNGQTFIRPSTARLMWGRRPAGVLLGGGMYAGDARS